PAVSSAIMQKVPIRIVNQHNRSQGRLPPWFVHGGSGVDGPTFEAMLRCTHRMLLAFPLLWAAGAVAALLYAQDRGIPWATALAVLPAFLLEVSLYFTM